MQFGSPGRSRLRLIPSSGNRSPSCSNGHQSPSSVRHHCASRALTTNHPATTGGPYTRPVAAAAFFDLDRTLLRRSSALALAGSFRDRGLISRRQLAKAALMQLLFVARGADASAVQRVAEDGLRILKGFTPDEMRELVASALEPVLKPLVYREPLALARAHKERGEGVYIVSAALQEIVDALASELDFDGALGTVCEVENGVYTGHSVRALHHVAKALAVRELAHEKGLDLAACTAYSDSASDLPFLELVGHPVAVNPDRDLRRIAADRGWPVLEVSAREYPHARRRVPPVVFGVPVLLGAAAVSWLYSRSRERRSS